jgi:hypothetical protein
MLKLTRLSRTAVNSNANAESLTTSAGASTDPPIADTIGVVTLPMTDIIAPTIVIMTTIEGEHTEELLAVSP